MNQSQWVNRIVEKDKKEPKKIRCINIKLLCYVTVKAEEQKCHY